MNRTMRDSTHPLNIPLAGTDIAAGYLNGTYENVAQLAARFPHIPRVLYDVNGSRPDADARDWEPGNEENTNLEQWVIDHNKHTGKKDAVIYSDRMDLPQVRQLTGSQILAVDYWLIVATLDGTVIMPGPDDLAHGTYPGVIACQDKGSAQTHGDYDDNIVFADWWKPVLPPPPVLVTKAQAGAALATLTRYVNQ